MLAKLRQTLHGCLCSVRLLHLTRTTGKSYVSKEVGPGASNDLAVYNFDFLKHIDSLVKKKIGDTLFVPSLRDIDEEKVERLLKEEKDYNAELNTFLQKLPSGLQLDPIEDRPLDYHTFDFSLMPSYESALKAVCDHLQLDLQQANRLLNSLIFRKKSFKLTDDYVEQLLQEMSDKLSLLLKHFTILEVCSNFQLVWYRLHVLKTRINIMFDVGVRRLRLEHLTHFKTLMALSPKRLKQLDIIDLDVNVLDNLLRILDDMPEQRKSEISRQYCSDLDNVSIARIKEMIIKEYLNYRIDCKTQIMKNFAAFFNLTIQNVKQVLDFIERGRNGIPLSIVKTTKFRNTRDWSYIILLNAELLHEFDREFDGQFLGKNIRYIVMQSPTIFSSIHNIKRKLHLLQHYYNVPDEHILTQLQVFTLTYNTILSRMQYWIGILGKRCTQHKNFLLLLRNHSKGLELRRALAEFDLRRIPLDLFFFHFHQMRKNIHFYSRIFVGTNRDLMERFANQLDMDVYALGRILKRHKHWKEMQADNATKVFYLLSNDLNLTKEQIRNSIYIVLYDYEDVLAVIESVRREHGGLEYDQWFRHPLFLELVIYHLEKHNHFDASAIIRKNLIGEEATKSGYSDEDLDSVLQDFSEEQKFGRKNSIAASYENELEMSEDSPDDICLEDPLATIDNHDLDEEDFDEEPDNFDSKSETNFETFDQKAAKRGIDDESNR